MEALRGVGGTDPSSLDGALGTDLSQQACRLTARPGQLKARLSWILMSVNKKTPPEKRTHKNQGLESSLCCRIAGQRLTYKECFFQTLAWRRATLHGGGGSGHA